MRTPTPRRHRPSAGQRLTPLLVLLLGLNGISCHSELHGSSPLTSDAPDGGTVGDGTASPDGTIGSEDDGAMGGPIADTQLPAADLGPPPAGSWQSELVHVAGGRLVYKVEANGNRLPDYSYAGYKNGAVALPTVPVKRTVVPGAGDDGAAIQQAIDQVAQMPLVDGFRGAVLISKGEYQVAQTLHLHTSGVVLRGEGSDADPAANTVIRRTDYATSQALIVGAKSAKGDIGWAAEVAGTRTEITTDFVPVGAQSFDVANASLFKVGDNVIVYHPCTDKWLAAVKYGGQPEIGSGWKAGELPIVYNRYITAISGNTITIDVPVFNELDRQLSQSVIYKHDRKSIVTNVGVENLRIDIDTKGETSESHAEMGIEFILVEDGWAKNVAVLHYVQRGFRFSTTTRVTVTHCKALEPHSQITGNRRYAFCAQRAQQILVRDSLATNARHPFVTDGESWDSGNVYYNNVSEGIVDDDGPHRRWATGILWDNIEHKTPVDYNVFMMQNRSDYGSAPQGWACSNCVAWHYVAPPTNQEGRTTNLVLQRPPKGQNYAIGCFAGNITGDGKHKLPLGYVEGGNKAGLYPPSLYQAQLAQRLAGR
ncbi:MAG: peptidoglycan-binding protein [Deltaproteobacteria bacterium]|nr:peptidoglycan-binding protein [Deltaproteobacteria bacterium]